MFLVLFLLVPVVALAGLLVLEARMHRGCSLAGPAGIPATAGRPELPGSGRAWSS